MEYVNGRNYKGGSSDYFDHVDGDMLGLIELKDIAEQLGYNADKVKFWHQFGESLESDVKQLETDIDVYSILKNPPTNGEVLIFFDHSDEPTQACLTQVEGILSQPTHPKSNNPSPDDDEVYQKLLKSDVVMDEADLDNDDGSYIADSDVAMEEDDEIYEECIDRDIEGDDEIYADEMYQKILVDDFAMVDDGSYDSDSDGDYSEDDSLYDQFVDSEGSEEAECDELYQKMLESDCEIEDSDEEYVDSGFDSGDDDKLYDKCVDPQAENKICDNDLKDALVNEQMLAKLVGDNEA
ncbi:hypothetical protein CASFOL_004613 [Castilleja foliolosa]|uniref:PB1-like domain-containing protein n=1 Tax=Castilleja foliolosa TaxID=1961234 RepID=A0ABD3EEM0_9LAMI